MREHELRRVHRQGVDPTPARDAARRPSLDAGYADIGAEHAPNRQAALELRERVGNAAFGRVLRQRERQGGEAREPAVQRAFVVQRAWSDLRESAIENMRARGWELDETGHGFTRASQSDHQTQPDHQAPPPGRSGNDSGVTPPPADERRTTMTIHAKKVASRLDWDRYVNEFGHAWVSFDRDGKHSAYGFYPRDEMTDDHLRESVPGEVRRDKHWTGATATKSVKLTDEQYAKAMAYMQAQSVYDVRKYNCADFAAGVYKAATGANVPGGKNWIIPNNPNDLHAGITRHNRRKRQA